MPGRRGCPAFAGHDGTATSHYSAFAAARLRVMTRASRSANARGSSGWSPSSTRASSNSSCAASSLNGRSLVAQLGQRHDQRVARIDLQHRLGGGLDPAGAGEQLFELPVGADVGRDQADRAVGQPVGGAHVRDLVAERLLDEGDESPSRPHRSPALGSLLGVVRGISARSAAPWRHRLERLAVERRRRRSPRSCRPDRPAAAPRRRGRGSLRAAARPSSRSRSSPAR